MSEDIEPFVIHLAQEADRHGVLALVPRLRAFGPSTLRPVESLDEAETRALERWFDAPVAGAALLVAACGERVVGCAYVEPAVDYFTGETYGHLGILAVAVEVEGRGVGAALMRAFEDWAKTARYRFVTLNVFAGNARARGFYEKSGYAPDTVRYARIL